MMRIPIVGKQQQYHWYPKSLYKLFPMYCLHKLQLVPDSSMDFQLALPIHSHKALKASINYYYYLPTSFMTVTYIHSQVQHLDHDYMTNY